MVQKKECKSFFFSLFWTTTVPGRSSSPFPPPPCPRPIRPWCGICRLEPSSAAPTPPGPQSSPDEGAGLQTCLLLLPLWKPPPPPPPRPPPTRIPRQWRASPLPAPPDDTAKRGRGSKTRGGLEGRRNGEIRIREYERVVMCVQTQQMFPFFLDLT